jgi:F1F0 ATPase subunit 2
MMTETLTLTLMLTPAWVAGGALGAMFFGGLWWTVQKALSSTRPALWFFSSWLLRMSLTLTGFYFVAGDQWQRLLMCLLGFVLARPIVTRVTRLTTTRIADAETQEVNDATQS